MSETMTVDLLLGVPGASELALGLGLMPLARRGHHNAVVGSGAGAPLYDLSEFVEAVVWRYGSEAEAKPSK